MTYRFPNSHFNGRAIKSHVAIDMDNSSEILFYINCAIYPPPHSKKYFDDDIRSYREYLFTFFNNEVFYDIFSQHVKGKYYIAKEDCFEWDNPQENVASIRHFESICTDIRCILRVHVSREDKELMQYPLNNSGFIIKMFDIIDKEFVNFQEGSVNKVVFPPNNIGKLRVENKKNIIEKLFSFHK